MSASSEDVMFISRCRMAIDTMRRAGINETLIGCVLTEVRSAAISGEFYRIQRLMELNPPKHYAHGEMCDIVKEWAPPSGDE